MKINTWKLVSRSYISKTQNGGKRKVLDGTWAFKMKRLSDGSPLKFKARFCSRGDQQTGGVDYFETFAPVVQWSTIRLLLTLTVANNRATRQVDYTNAFAQAKINDEVYVEPPKGFSLRKDKKKTQCCTYNGVYMGSNKPSIHLR
mmetsp:Transcript_19449/g.18681  ORF Transcript_19449/g.18681 Transcript_19449/m.18681 type:complete len:145 (-) Transcript_19449:20-454(-)